MSTLLSLPPRPRPTHPLTFRRFLTTQVVDKAMQILKQWNGRSLISQTIRLNKPGVWTREATQEKLMVEPFIEGFTKFNSNSGWVNPQQQGWNDALQICWSRPFLPMSFLPVPPLISYPFSSWAGIEPLLLPHQRRPVPALRHPRYAQREFPPNTPNITHAPSLTLFSPPPPPHSPKGGVYRDGAVLTDPIITSHDGRFGPADLGSAGAY